MFLFVVYNIEGGKAEGASSAQNGTAIRNYPPLLLAGLRDSTIGTDTAMYPIHVFEFCLETKSLVLALVSYLNVEQGYVALAWMSSQISNSFNFFLTLTHAIMLTTLLAAYRKFHINYALAFVFFYLIYFSTSMNATRQFLAMPFCVLCLGEYINGRYKWAVMSFLLAFAFHRSVLFLLAVIILYHLCTHR